MIRLLPPRPPFARGRRLLASLPPGLMTILTVGAAVGVVLGMPWVAATLDEPASTQRGASPTTVEASAPTRPATPATPGAPGPTAPRAPTAPPSAVTYRDVGAAILAGARLVPAGPASTPVAPPEPPPAEQRPAGRAPAEVAPSAVAPPAVAPTVPSPAAPPGTLGDPSSTSVWFAVSGAGPHPSGHLEIRSGSARIAAASIDSLAAEGRVATWSGEARWAGASGYTFSATAVDGTAAGVPGSDRLAISVRGADGALVWQADWPVVAGDVVVDAAGASLRGDATGVRSVRLRSGGRA